MPKRNGTTAVQKVTTAQASRHVPAIGRPPKYNAGVAVIVEHCIRTLFMTDEEVCRVIGIGPSTWYVWRHKYPAFREATTRAKEIANKTVEASLFKTATGYSIPAVKIFMVDEVVETVSKTGKRTIIRKQVPVTVDFLEHVPGEYKAQAIWLERRNPQRWHPKQTDAPPPPLPAGEEQARQEAWRKMIAMIKQNAADGGPPLLTTLPAPEEAKDVTPTLAGVKK